MQSRRDSAAHSVLFSSPDFVSPKPPARCARSCGWACTEMCITERSSSSPCGHMKAAKKPSLGKPCILRLRRTFSSIIHHIGLCVFPSFEPSTVCGRWVLLRAVSRRGKSLASLLVCSVFSCEASPATGHSGWVWLWEGGEGQMAEMGF